MNVVLQAVIYLGFHFKNRVELNFYNPDTYETIYLILKQFIQAYHLQLTTVFNSFRFRLAVAQYPHRLADHIYTNGSQQDAFEFLTDLLQCFSNSIKELFKFESSILVNCECGSQLICDRLSSYFLMITRSSNNANINFSDLFKNVTNEFCSVCKQNRLITKQKVLNNEIHGRYLIIHIPLFQLTVDNNPPPRYVTKIKNYDPNNILIHSLSGGFYS